MGNPVTGLVCTVVSLERLQKTLSIMAISWTSLKRLLSQELVNDNEQKENRCEMKREMVQIIPELS